jgi:hypothetical protein
MVRESKNKDRAFRLLMTAAWARFRAHCKREGCGRARETVGNGFLCISAEVTPLKRCVNGIRAGIWKNPVFMFNTTEQAIETTRPTGAPVTIAPYSIVEKNSAR